MCLSQHHCVNNAWDQLISLTNDWGCPICQHHISCPHTQTFPVSSHITNFSQRGLLVFFSSVIGPMTYYESDRNVIKKPFSEGHSTRVLDISFQINNIRDNIFLRIGFERKLRFFLKSGTSLTNYPSKVEMLILQLNRWSRIQSWKFLCTLFFRVWPDLLE